MNMRFKINVSAIFSLNDHLELQLYLIIVRNATIDRKILIESGFKTLKKRVSNV